MNLSKFIEGLELQQQATAMMIKAAKEFVPIAEPALNKSKLAKATGHSRATIAALMKAGKVQTFEEGKKSKASEIQRALQDGPVRVARTKYLRVFQ